MSSDPNRRPRKRENVDVERGTDIDEGVSRRDGETGRTVESEHEDRRVRPGEKRPQGTMP